jgi:putative ABC transport system permease protein
VAVAILVIVTATTNNEVAALSSQYGSLANTQLLVQTAPITDVPVERTMSQEFVDGVERLPGVERAVRGQAAYLTDSQGQALVEGYGGPSHSPLLARARDDARAAVLSGKAAIIDRRYAQRRHLHQGSVLVVDTPSGTRFLPVAQVVDIVDFTNGLVGVPLAWFESSFRRLGATWIEVSVERGVDRTVVAHSILATAGPRAPIYAATGPQVLNAARQDARQGAALFGNAVNSLLIFGSGLAILNTLLLSVVQRRRELGVLRALGASRRQVRVMVLGETAALVAIGCLLGLMLGEVGQFVTLHILNNVLGITIGYRFVPTAPGLGVLGAVAIGIIGAAIPAVRVGRLSVVAAIGYE